MVTHSSILAWKIPWTEEPGGLQTTDSVPLPSAILEGFPGGSEGKASACNVGDLGSIPGSGRSPGEEKWQPSPVPLPGKSHGWRSLVGYSLSGCKESDMIERLHFHFLNG